MSPQRRARLVIQSTSSGVRPLGGCPGFFIAATLCWPCRQVRTVLLHGPGAARVLVLLHMLVLVVLAALHC
jgi:hypothetical protein